MALTDDFGASLADTAKQEGQSAINSFDPTSVANSNKNAINSLYNTQSGTIGSLTSKFADTIAKNPTVTDLYKQGNSLYNVDPLGQQATDLTNRVTNAIPDAYSGARGYNIGNTAINNGIASKLAYLTPQANAATANYNQASDLASKFVTAGQAQNTQNLLPIQSQITSENDAMARQSTGFTAAMQQELEGLIEKLNAGVTLSTNDMTRANQLAALGNSYRTAIDTARIGQQYQTVKPSETLLNTFTGNIVKG